MAFSLFHVGKRKGEEWWLTRVIVTGIFIGQNEPSEISSQFLDCLGIPHTYFLGLDCLVSHRHCDYASRIIESMVEVWPDFLTSGNAPCETGNR